MRVVFVGPFPWPSHQGSQAYLAAQARALAARGHDVRLAVYAGTGGEIPGVELVRGRPIPGGAFEGGGLHPSRPAHDLALARAIRRSVRARPADVLHAHNVEGPLIARLARTGLPVVYDLHTAMAEELPDHLPRALARWAGPAGEALDRLALAASDAGCAISPRALARFERAGLPALEVGPSVDPGDLRARPGVRARLGDGPFVVYTGNLDRYQGLDRLLAAREGLPARLLVVTGSDDPLPADVQVVRSRDWRDALDALSVAAVAVIPRARCAGFPIKLLNHLGMGVPTVMCAGAEIPLPGVVVSPADGLHGTLRDLLADPARRAELGAAGAAFVRAHHTPEAQAERLEALYARVSASSRRTR